MYIKDPSAIEIKSFEIIKANMKKIECFSEDELRVVMRTIHTTGDYDYENIVKFNGEAIEIGKDLIKNGCNIVTDTKMAYSGINKRLLAKYNCNINNYIADEETFKIAKEQEITRSMAAVDIAFNEEVDIFVVGNAPTALFRIGELIEAGNASPKLIIAVPVGFVGAAESKEYVRGIKIPSISTQGNKGGSNVAASIINALIYMVERQ